jgi:thioredoxin reductase
MKKTETLIVGAGPYGLSIAAHLKAANIPFQIFGSPMESWRSYMPDGMLLRSEVFASNLWDPKRKYTFKRYAEAKNLPYQHYGKPLSLTGFLEYADWFSHHAVGEVRDLRAKHIRETANGFLTEFNDGTQIESRQVVLATGHMAFCFTPPELSQLPESVCQHSAQIKDIKRYSGRDVIVVGAGQAALETAALLQEGGARVRLLVRKDKLRWNAFATDVRRSIVEKIRKPEAGLGSGWKTLAISELPRVFRWMFPMEKRHRFVQTNWGPAGAYWLKDRVEGKIEVLFQHQLRGSKYVDGKVRLSVEGRDGIKELIADCVVPATGFKPDIDLLDYLDPEIKKKIEREGKAPALSSNFETSVPGLFIVGISTAPIFGPVMRFMFGAKHAAPIITGCLKSRR